MPSTLSGPKNQVVPLILLVEDNPAEVRLVRESLAEHHDAVELLTVPDGRKALIMLKESNRQPDLILLDLNLPGMDGRSLLTWIKTDPKLRRIPVIVLTSSDAAPDVKRAYDSHANCYLVKPFGLDAHARLIRDTIVFWTRVAELPARA